MSYEPDFRPTDMSDVGSMISAFQSARIKENTEYAIRLAALEADLKRRSELKKEMLFKISKIVEEIPQMLKNNPIEGIMWINDIPEYLRQNEIDSSAFETLDFKELADKTWKKIDELEKYALTNLPDAIIAYEKAKDLHEDEIRRNAKREEEREAALKQEAEREVWRQTKKGLCWGILFIISCLIFIARYEILTAFQNLDYDLRQSNESWARFRGHQIPANSNGQLKHAGSSTKTEEF